MKIRVGFVSNSSSSSFCILGFKVTDDVREKARAATGERNRDDDWDTFKALGLEYYSEAWSTSEDSLGAVAGVGIDNHTVDELIEVTKKLSDTFGDVEVRVMAGEYSC